MVTDEQVRRLRKLSNTEKNQEIAASKAGMDPTTARRYLGLERLPSELKKERQGRTPEAPFGEAGAAGHGRADPKAATADEALAGDGGTGAGRVLRPKTRAGAVVRVGLHAHDRVGNHPRGTDVRAPGVPLRADIFELGGGNHLLFGEPGEPQRRLAKRGVGIGSGSGRAPHRQPVERG